jgi:flagellar motor protein MotB
MSAGQCAGRPWPRRRALMGGLVVLVTTLTVGAGATWAGPVAVLPSGWTGWWSTVTVTDAEQCREVTIPSDVLFASDSAVPGPGLQEAVEQGVRAAREVPGPVHVDGFLDDRGPENVPLSTARADNVAEALVAAGIDPARILTMGRGEADPVASNATESGRAQNRRVEIRVGACPPAAS